MTKKPRTQPAEPAKKRKSGATENDIPKTGAINPENAKTDATKSGNSKIIASESPKTDAARDKIPHATTVYLPHAVGGGYGTFWNYTGRYRVVKGSRASKKSKTAALNLIYRMMKFPDANALVVRRVYRTLRDSCFTELKWAAARLGVSSLWDAKESPLEMTYRPTGQKIYFRGLDDAMKVTSIAVPHGALCWLWVEEAYEIAREEDFDLLNESIRGEVAPPLFKQTTLTFNPWSERHWLKKRFFDTPSDGVLAMTTDYRCNEFLDDADRALFAEMKERNPRRYRVAALGEWGITDGLVFENWEEMAFSVSELSTRDSICAVFGLDFGYVADPTALFCGLLDATEKTLYVFDELYERGLSNEQIFAAVAARGYAKECICADAAEPKSIDRLRLLGLRRITPARKGPDSVRAGIDFLRDYHIVVHPCCQSFLREISTYAWQSDAHGETLNTPVDRDNHLMDAMRYAVSPHMRGERMGF